MFDHVTIHTFEHVTTHLLQDDEPLEGFIRAPSTVLTVYLTILHKENVKDLHLTYLTIVRPIFLLSTVKLNLNTWRKIQSNSRDNTEYSANRRYNHVQRSTDQVLPQYLTIKCQVGSWLYLHDVCQHHIAGSKQSVMCIDLYYVQAICSATSSGCWFVIQDLPQCRNYKVHWFKVQTSR